MDNVAFEKAISLKKELDTLIKVKNIMNNKDQPTAHHFYAAINYSRHLVDSEQMEIPTRFNDRFMSLVNVLIADIRDEIEIQIKKANEN